MDARSRPLLAPTLLLGIALGGFFDGILLHQVLQWHHLLSALERDGWDLGAQIMADGLFHVAMYGLAVAALVWLAQRRAALAAPGAARTLAAGTLLGFAAWQLIDIVLAHWVLGIHRVRMDTGLPLAWDLGWLVVFGGPSAALGAPGAAPGPTGADPRTVRREPHPIFSGPGAALALAAVALVLGAYAAGPAAPHPDASGRVQVLIVLPDARTGPRLLAALDDDTRVVGTDRRGTVWRLALDPSTHPASLWRHGARWVSGGPLPAACADQLRL